MENEHAKVNMPEDPDKTIAVSIDPDRTIVLSEKELNSRQVSSQNLPQEEKHETFSFTWFRGSRDVNALISDENRTKLGADETRPIQISCAENCDPQLISVEQLYQKRRDFNGGGQGILSEQFDLALGRTIAVKSLRKEFLDKPDSRASFIREAKISSRLEHPSIIPIYSLTGDKQQGLHLAMKLIKGMALSDYLKEICTHYEKEGIKTYNEGKTLLYRLDLFLRICDALAYAHSRNIMHRDLKPENILIGQYREIYVMDWGIAQHIVQNPEAKEKSKSLWGTPAFMSPEMLRGENCDQRADIYALGMILFEMVYLKQGITGKTLQEILDRAKNARFEPFRHRFGFPVSPELTAIIKKAVQLDLTLRYQTVEEFSLDLRRFLAGEETKAKPDHFIGKILRWMNRHRKIVALLMILLVLGFLCSLAWSFYRQRNEEIYRRRYDSASTSLAYNAAVTANEIEHQLLTLGMFLQLFCEEATVRLNNPAGQGGALPIPFMSKGKALPSGAVYSPFYKMNLNLDRFGAFVAKKNGNVADAQKQIEKLTPMLEKSRLRFLKIALPDSGMPQSVEEQKKQFATNGGAMVWFYLGMENGLYLQYPATDALPAEFDPRRRPWYQTGFVNTTERLIWSKPYRSAQTKWPIMTGTRSFQRADQTIGVAGFDVSLDYFGRIIEKFSTDSHFTRGKYILDEEGNILVAADRESDSVWGGHGRIDVKVNQESYLNVKTLDSDNVFEEIRQRKVNTAKRQTPSGTLLYLFFPIRTMRWTYVEIVAIDDYLKSRH